MNENLFKDFLDFSLLKLNEVFPKGLRIKSLASYYKQKTGIWINDKDQCYFLELYNNLYFQQVDTTSSYKISAETKSIIEKYGTLSAYLELNENERLKNENERNKLKELQRKNLELQNENFEFSQTIRTQESKIRELELKIKGIELLKQYWWIIGLCIIFGGILANLWNLFST